MNRQSVQYKKHKNYERIDDSQGLHLPMQVRI